MTKKTLGQKTQESIIENMKKIGNEKTNISDAVITSPQQIKYIPLEERTARLQAMITKSEMEFFENSIGRKGKSDIIRELILYTLGLPTYKQENRDLILNLISKNND